MKASKLAPIAMLLTFVLGALPAAAGNRGHDRGDAGLARLSHGLAAATAELRDEVAASRRGWRFHQRHTLRALDRLERDAKVFHRRVENEGVYDHSTRRAFRHLEASFAAANDHFPARRMRHSIRHDFAQVAALMEKVEHRMARLDRGLDQRRHAGHEGSGSWRVAGRFGH
jgi:hypothetical protein